MTLHYTSGGPGEAIAAAGFNIADVQYVSQLDDLPDGMKGLVWLGERSGATAAFRNKVTPFIGHPKLFGFFLWDEPDPTGRWGPLVTPANLKSQANWIHQNVPGAMVFIAMMNMGSSDAPDYSNTYNPANTNIDLFGINCYPVTTTAAPDYGRIDRNVAAAVAAGIPLSKIVPIYQAFGGGGWQTDEGGAYTVPTQAQLTTMLTRWRKAVPNPVMDYAYKWGTQNGDIGLESLPSLQAACREHNVTAPPTPVNPLAAKLRAYADAIDAGTLKPSSGVALHPDDGSVFYIPD